MLQTPINRPYYTWIDLAKVTGIFLVIYGHGGLANPVLKGVIYTFHMPLFFLLSGLLYHPISLKKTLKKDWHTLIIPYLLLNFLCLIPFLLSPLKGTFTLERLFQRLGAIALGLGYEHNYWIPVCTPCWFLISLFLARIIFSLAHKHFNNKSITIIAITSIVITFILHIKHIDLLIPLDSTLLAMPYLCIGYKLKTILLDNNIVTYNKSNYLLVVISLFSLTYLIWCFNGPVDTNKCLYGNSMILYYLGGISGSLGICFLSKCIKIEGKFNHTIASGTLLIIGLNLWMIVFVKKIFNIIFPNTEISGFMGFIIAVICLIIFYLLIKIAKRYFPIILGKRK